LLVVALRRKVAFEVVDRLETGAVVLRRAHELTPAESLAAVLALVALHLVDDAELEKLRPGPRRLLAPPPLAVHVVQNHQRVEFALLPEALQATHTRTHSFVSYNRSWNAGVSV
jgi:hypothetical protein